MGKVYGAQARVKSKVAAKFNAAVDAPLNKVQAKAKPAVKGAKPTKQEAAPKEAAAKGEKKMGFWFFGKKDKGQAADDSGADEGEVAEAKTQAINIAQFEDVQFKPCVGWVVVLDGPQKGRDFRLVPGRNRVGTHADMEVVLTDPYVSSHHATIVYTNDGVYQISDAGSTNGTKVNSKKVMQCQLLDNDRLTIGHTECKFKALE